MSPTVHLWIVPAYLLLCLLLGGSSQGTWSIAALQLLAVLLIGWAAVSSRAEPISRPARLLLLLAGASILAVLLQLVPLPPELWTGLPGREPIASGYALLGGGIPWLSLSMAPYTTLETAYRLLPPLAVFVGVISLRAYRERWIAGAILAGAFASVVLGALQVASSSAVSWAHLYEHTNTGAVGFFANRNHMATLLVAAVPFAVALFISARPAGRGRGRSFGMLALGGGGLLLVILGLLLNSSLAALALAVPVFAFSVLILPVGWRWRRFLIPAAILAILVSVAALGSASVRAGLAGTADFGSLHSRGRMWGTTLEAVGASFPFGTGLGTFDWVYAFRENPALTEPTYINHAHNDYLELLLEMGVAGLVLMLAFLAWWVWTVIRVWRSPLSSEVARAATIASAAILVHSSVDYPLRAAAIAALFAACLALMAQRPRPKAGEQPRHVRIG